MILVFYFTSRAKYFFEQIPFGITYGNGKLYMTDWGLGGIYEVDVGYSKNAKSARDIVVGIGKPTGIKYATLDYER